MRRILITGANKGIGFAIASRVLEDASDAFVLLGARSPERGRAAVEAIGRANPDHAARVAHVEIDVADEHSVEHAAARVAEDYGRHPAPLYAVVNNAGIGLGDADLAAVLETNTYGVERVCRAFLSLVEPDGGRIVNVTSASGPNFVAVCSPEMQRFFTDPDVTWKAIDELMQTCLGFGGDPREFAARGLADGAPYGLSKACANSLTMWLARENPGLSINACTPGYIETDMTRPSAARQGRSPADLGMKPPREGTKSVLHLLFGELEGNGRYYGSDAERSPLDRYRGPGTPAYQGD